MKTLWCILGLAVTALAMGCSGKESKDPASEPDKFADDSMRVEYLPACLEDDGPWGLYGLNGQRKYPDLDFRLQPTAVLNGYFAVREHTGYKVYRAGTRPAAVPGADSLYSAGAMSEGLMPVSHRNERITLIDGQGNVKATFMPVGNDEIVSTGTTFSEGLIMITDRNQNIGYADREARVVIAPQYNFAFNFGSGVAPVSTSLTKGNQFTLIDRTGKTVFTYPTEDKVLAFNVYGMSESIDPAGRISIYDKTGKKLLLLPETVKGVTRFSDRFLVYVTFENTWGVMDIGGKDIFKPVYRYIGMTDDSDFILQTDSGIILADEKGNELFRFADSYRSVIEAGRFGYIAETGGKFVMLNRQGQPANTLQFAEIATDIAPADQVYSGLYARTHFKDDALDGHFYNYELPRPVKP